MGNSSFALPQGATATRAGLGLATTDSVQFAKLGLGEAADASRILLVTGDVSGGVATLERSNASTNGVLGTMIVKGTSTGNMADGFGTAFQFAIEDDAAVENLIANISAVRSGADNTGVMKFGLYTAGASANAMGLSPGTLEVYGTSSLSGGIALFEDTDNGGNYALIQAPTSMASSRTLTLPDATTTLVGTDATQTLTNKTFTAPVISAHSASAGTAMKLTAGTLMTTAEDGAIELDDNCFYGTTDAGNRGYIPVRHFIRCNATRTLPNDSNLNAIFNDPTNGRLTLETGTYLFEAVIGIKSMSATSGNAAVDILGAGTATVNDWLYAAIGKDNTLISVAAVLGTMPVIKSTPASMFTAGTGAEMWFTLKGTFTVTAGGTLIPSIDQVTGAAAVVQIGSYFSCERIGSTTVVSVGQWD